MNKRTLKRNLLLKPIKIFNKISHEHIGNIIDIHTEGMKIVSKYHFQINELMDLLIDLPDANLSIHEIELTAKNVWSQDFIVNRYFSGLQFENVSPETKRNLMDHLIRKYGFTA